MIVSLAQIAAGRSGDGKSDYNRSYTVVWRAIVDDPRDGPATVGSAAGLPARFSPYVGYENTDDPAALCTSLKPDQIGADGEWRVWKITATFETQFTQGQDQHENPTDRPPEYWVEFQDETRSVTKTYNDLDIVNSAGQLIAGLERDYSVATIVIQRYESAFDPQSWLEFQNTTNSGTFSLSGIGSFDDQTLLMKITTGKAETINSYRVWPVTYRLKYKEDTWRVNPADVGTAVLGSDGKLHLPIDPATQQPKDGEVYLDGDGQEITDLLNNPIEYIGNKALYRPRDWSPLSL